MIYFIYDLLIFLAYLIYFPIYALRGRVSRASLERLGIFQKGKFDGLAGQDVVWVHAVSVGEARAAESLVNLMRAAWPGRRLVISTVTPTGQELVRRYLMDTEIAIYAPLDISWIVAKFLKVLKPKLLVIFETEIWPNLIRLSKAAGVRVVIVNGRLSDKSFACYERFKAFVRPVLAHGDLFCMQTEAAAERIKALGAWYQKVHVTGNIKFDMASSVSQPAFLAALESGLGAQSLWVAGSTHEGEEEILVSVYRALKKDFPSLRLMIAPRHLERLEKVRRVVRLAGFDSVNVSRMNRLGSSAVLILDTIGDLSAMYRLSAIAFVGGSLVARGGHNPIEPAVFARPILFGPHMENFREIRGAFMNEKAAIEVKDGAGLEYEMRNLLNSATHREAIGARARALLDKNRGAAERTMRLLEREK
jgi:3-deoxy-D-manno-octulosonic-acid transferase